MTTLKKVAILNSKTKFQAIANVAFSIPVAMFEGVKMYNEDFKRRIDAANNVDSKLPASMSLRYIHRGDIINIGDGAVVNEETGAIEVYPKEVFNELNKFTVELPCAMQGSAKDSFDKAMALLPESMRNEFSNKRNDVISRFRIVPFLEVYTDQVLTD
jgi:hypothetical protein